MTRRLTLRRTALTGLVGVAVCVLAPAPAQAHPFGDPQRAAISATSEGLHLVWNATPDDLAVLASWIGATGGNGSLMVFEDGEFDPGESTELPGIQLAKAPQLSDYLLERITVSAAGVPCPGEVLPVADVEVTGVGIDFDCGDAVSSAEVRVRTLTDVDEAYRTMATGPLGQGHAYTADTDTVTWALTAEGAAAATTGGDRASSARSAARQMGALGVGVAVAVGLGTVVVRRRRASAPD